MDKMDGVPKWRKIAALAVLFLSSMCTMGDFVINPIIMDVYEAFSNSPEALVDLGITGPALVGVPFGLLAGALCDRYDKKTVMVVGFLIFTAASVFGAMRTDVVYFVIARLFASGVGWGITNIAAFAILVELSDSKQQRAKFVGWYAAAMSTLGALMAVYSSAISADGWTRAFNTYLFAVPVLLLLIVFLPNFPGPLTKGYDESHPRGTLDLILFNSEAPEARVVGWMSRIFPLALQALVVSALCFSLLYMVGVYLADVGIEGELPAGFATGTMTGAAAIGSLTFGAAHRRAGNGVCILPLFAFAAALLLLGLAPAIPFVFVILLVAGFSWSYLFCYFYTRCAEIAPLGKRGVSTSVVAAALGFGATISSYLVMAGRAFSDGGCALAYTYLGVVLLLVAVFTAVPWLVRHTRVTAAR